MGAAQYVEILAGLVILLVIMHDLFQAVVLPRPSVYRLPLVSQLLVRQFWSSGGGWGTSGGAPTSANTSSAPSDRQPC